MLKVKDRDGLYRDPTSGAIINKDKSGAKMAKLARQNRLAEQQRLSAVEDKLERIETLLTKILER